MRAPRRRPLVSLLLVLVLPLLLPVTAGTDHADEGGIRVEIDDGQVGEVFAPAQQETLRVAVSNSGAEPREVHLTYTQSGADGAPLWDVNGTSDPFVVQPGDKRNVAVTVTAPRAEGASPHRKTLFVNAFDTDRRALGTAAFDVTLATVDVIPARRDITLGVGNDTRVEWILRSPSDVPVEGDLVSWVRSTDEDRTSRGWRYTPDYAEGTPVRLAPGEEIRFNTTIHLAATSERPADVRLGYVVLPLDAGSPQAGERTDNRWDAVRYGAGEITLRAADEPGARPADTGAATPSSSDPVRPRGPTTPWSDVPDLPRRPDGILSMQVAPGMLVTEPGAVEQVNVQIQNPGSRFVRTTIRAAPEDATGWQVTPETRTIALGPGDHAVIPFTVTAAEDEGEVVHVPFTATSAADATERYAAWTLYGYVRTPLEGVRLSINNERPLPEQPFGSQAYVWYVHDESNEARSLRMHAVVAGEPGYVASTDPEFVTLDAGGEDHIVAQLVTPSTPPAVENGLTTLLVIASDESGREAVATRTFHWSTYAPDNHGPGPGPGPDSVERDAGLLAVLLLGGGLAMSGTIVTIGHGLRHDTAWLRRLLAPLAGMYTRIRKPRVLDHKTRARIHALVQAEPGLAFAELRNRLGIGRTTLTHHLKMLENHGYVTSRRVRAHLCFYPPGHAPRPEAVAWAPTPTQQRVLDLLADGPLTQGEIAQRLDITRQAVNQHVKVLERHGCLALERAGRRVRCHALDAD